MKHIKLYESFDIQETWIDEPEDNLDYKFVLINNNLYLIEKYNKTKSIIYKNYTYNGNLIKHKNTSIIFTNSIFSLIWPDGYIWKYNLQDILSNKKSFKIYKNMGWVRKYKDWRSMLFKYLDENIQSKILESYNIK